MQHLCRNASDSVYDNIKKNNLPLFIQKNSIVSSKSKEQQVSITSDQQIYGSLYIDCHSRKGDLNSFFAHKKHRYLISISKYGQLRQCKTKLDLLACVLVRSS